LSVGTNQVRQSFNTSLNNLQTAYVDSLVLHSPMPTHAQVRSDDACSVPNREHHTTSVTYSYLGMVQGTK